MLLVYSILFIIVGFTGVISSLSIAVREKSLIKLQHLFGGSENTANMKYKFYSQFVTGMLFIAYGLVVYKTDLSNILIHMLFIITVFIIVKVISYIKFVVL